MNCIVYSGPIKNSALVGREFLTLVAKEQQLAIPKAEQWAEARETYMNVINKFRPAPGLSWSNQVMGRMASWTWADVATGGKVAVELSALYFIAQLAGKAATYPFTVL